MSLKKRKKNSKPNHCTDKLWNLVFCETTPDWIPSINCSDVLQPTASFFYQQLRRSGLYYADCIFVEGWDISPLVFIIHPTTGQMWHNAFLRWVGSQVKAHTFPALPKIPSAPSVFLLLRAHRAPGNKPNPLKGVKAWGDAHLRPEELSSAEAHPAEPPSGETACRMQPNNWKGWS